MAVDLSEGTSPGEEPDLQAVANAFVTQYYMVLHKFPQDLHKFYKDQSVLDWAKLDGTMTSATTMQAINRVIMSSDYTGCLVEIVNAYAQDSLMDGIIVAVTGCLIGKDRLKKIISQTFFLAKQENGYFVLNDIFRFVDAQESLNPSIASDTDEKTTNAPLARDPEPADVPAEPKPVKIPTTAEARSSDETVSKVTDTTVEVPKLSITPTQNVKHEHQKFSYASVVAKESKIASPTDNFHHRIIRVAATANQQSSASPAPTSNSVTKEQISSGNGSTENNNNINKSGSSNGHAEAVISKTVYIQNLPSDISENELADAVKKFGRVRPGGIQLRRYEDGFCFGFVEFESPSSAKSAIEAREIIVRGNDCRISYKKSGTRAGNGTRASGGIRSGTFKGQENGEFHATGGYRDDNQAHLLGRARGFDRQNGELGWRNSQSRGGRANGGEAYSRNNWRNEETLSNKEAHQRSNERGKSQDRYRRNNRRNERAAGEGGSK
ncbi:hypothetical protein ACH5RR_035962 [Cinchona calisaya]|uniref:Uncharacterized protein n=1 Tax=Cinchona calisaya TaxID=153742 RepID=A0ABD2Y7C9_9GENT